MNSAAVVPIELTEHERQVSELALRESRIIAAARQNRDVFISYVLEDSRGVRMRPAAIHKSWTEHIEQCIAERKYCSIVAPWGHGKTEQMIGHVLFDLGRNPENRIKIVSNSDGNAKKRLAVIKNIIEENPRFKLVFPNIEPDKERGWSSGDIYIKRKGASKDPSVEAAGILSSGTGTRADQIFFDDPVDVRNALLEPKKRESVKTSLCETWLSRLDTPPKGINYCSVIYIATVYHEEDATYSYVMKNKAFSVLFQSIREPEMNSIVCNARGRAWHIPLWKEKFGWPELRAKRDALKERGYARGFQNKPFSDSDIVLKNISKCLNYGMTAFDAMKCLGNNWRIIASVDPAGSARKGFAIFVGAVAADTHVRVPLDLRVGNWIGKSAINQCVEVQKLWNPSIFIIENNAVQSQIRAWIQDAGEGNILTKAFNTGSNKADLEAGIPGMDIEFEKSLWCIALAGHDHRGDPDCSCAWCRWAKEMLYYPLYGSSDLLMASWFFREEARGGRSVEELLDGIQINTGARESAHGMRGGCNGNRSELYLASGRASVSRKQLAKRAGGMNKW